MSLNWNPRLSVSFARADHCFQLNKIKDIMCFHYFIFATRKKSHELQHTSMQVFHFWGKKTVFFPISLYLAVFSCRWNELIIINYHYFGTKNWINEKSGLKNIKGSWRHFVWPQFLVLFRQFCLSRSSSSFKIIVDKITVEKTQKKARLGPCILRWNENKSFTKQKTGRDKAQIYW